MGLGTLEGGGVGGPGYGVGGGGDNPRTTVRGTKIKNNETKGLKGGGFEKGFTPEKY